MTNTICKSRALWGAGLISRAVGRLTGNAVAAGVRPTTPVIVVVVVIISVIVLLGGGG